MRRILVGGPVVVLLAAACSSGDGGDSSARESEETTETTQAPGPALEVDDSPIVDVVTAASIDEAGAVVDPAYAFTPDAPQITTVVSVGEFEGPVRTGWFQVVEEDWEETSTKLFEHRVDVKPFERAFSIGTSPGVLETGTYRVVVVAGEDKQTAEFEVVSGETARSTAQAASGSGGPPRSGGSGAQEAPTPQEFEGDRDAAFVLLLGVRTEQPDLRAPSVKMGVNSVVPFGATADHVAYIRVRGGPEMPYIHPNGVDVHDKENYVADPCSLSGGSDLPGAEVEFSGVLNVGEQGTVGGSPTVITLGPDETSPKNMLNPSIPAGSRVESGDTIGIDVLATDKKEGGTWQTGIKSIQLIETTEGLIDDKQGTRLPPKCDDAARGINWQTKYEVTDDSPNKIELCALAEDHAGNVKKSCAKFYKGEVWEGTLTSTGTGGTGVETFSADVTLVVDEDGVVEGDGKLSAAGAFGTPYTEAFRVEGEASDTRFDLHFLEATDTCFAMATGTTRIFCWGVPEGSIPKQERTAKGTFDTNLGQTSFTTTLDLKCKTCGKD